MPCQPEGERSDTYSSHSCLYKTVNCEKPQIYRSKVDYQNVKNILTQILFKAVHVLTEEGFWLKISFVLWGKRFYWIVLCTGYSYKTSSHKTSRHVTSSHKTSRLQNVLAYKTSRLQNVLVYKTSSPTKRPRLQNVLPLVWVWQLYICSESSNIGLVG